MSVIFNTSYLTYLDIILHELYHLAGFYVKYHLTDKLLNYGLLLGRNILYALGIVFNFENKTITWQEVSIPMKPPDCNAKEFFVIKESSPVKQATKRIK